MYQLRSPIYTSNTSQKPSRPLITYLHFQWEPFTSVIFFGSMPIQLHKTRTDMYFQWFPQYLWITTSIWKENKFYSDPFWTINSRFFFSEICSQNHPWIFPSPPYRTFPELHKTSQYLLRWAAMSSLRGILHSTDLYKIFSTICHTLSFWKPIHFDLHWKEKDWNMWKTFSWFRLLVSTCKFAEKK